MSISNEFLTYVLDQLRGVGGITSKRMFGGAGIYARGKMFALVADDVLYLKVDDTNRPDFEKAGMGPFQLVSYYEIPPDVLEDADELAAWAKKAIAVAGKTKKKTKRL